MATTTKSRKATTNDHKTEAELDAALAAQLVANEKAGKYDEPAEEDEPKAKPTMAAQLRKHRAKYQTTSTNDRLSLDNGDDVATLLRGATPEQVVAAAEVLLGLPTGELAAKYAKLNNGQRRMNAGNRIRGAIKRGDKTAAEAKAALAA